MLAVDALLGTYVGYPLTCVCSWWRSPSTLQSPAVQPGRLDHHPHTECMHIVLTHSLTSTPLPTSDAWSSAWQRPWCASWPPETPLLSTHPPATLVIDSVQDKAPRVTPDQEQDALDVSLQRCKNRGVTCCCCPSLSTRRPNSSNTPQDTIPCGVEASIRDPMLKRPHNGRHSGSFAPGRPIFPPTSPGADTCSCCYASGSVFQGGPLDPERIRTWDHWAPRAPRHGSRGKIACWHSCYSVSFQSGVHRHDVVVEEQTAYMTAVVWWMSRFHGQTRV